MESAIPEGKKVLKAHTENLGLLTKVLENLFGLPSLVSLQMEPETTSKTLYNELRACAALPASKNGEIIGEQVEQLGKEVRVLWEKIHEMEMELHGWKFSQKLARTTIDHLKEMRAPVESDIEMAKEAFRAVWRIPADVWAQVFRLVQHMEFSCYIEQTHPKSLRPVVHVFSHVCLYWRWIVFNEPSLWSLVYIPPVQSLRQDEYDLLATSIEKSTQPLTLLVNTEQGFKYGYHQNQRYEPNRSLAQPLFTDGHTLFKGGLYTLHINMSYDYSAYLSRLSYITFREPSSVIVSVTQHLNQGSLFSYLSFRNLRSLTIIANSIVLPGSNLSSLYSSLRSLTLHFKQFMAGSNISGYLISTLEELHIRHESGAFPTFIAGVSLPKLQILGISPPGHILLQSITIPTLRRLILYGPGNPEENVQVAVGDNVSRIYRRIESIEFRHWGVISTGITQAGAVSTFEQLIPNVPALRSLKFIDCFLDGEALVVALYNTEQGTSIGCLKYLEAVTLGYTSGVTRVQCDLIKTLIYRVDIYI